MTKKKIATIAIITACAMVVAGQADACWLTNMIRNRRATRTASFGPSACGYAQATVAEKYAYGFGTAQCGEGGVCFSNSYEETSSGNGGSCSIPLGCYTEYRPTPCGSVEKTESEYKAEETGEIPPAPPTCTDTEYVPACEPVRTTCSGGTCSTQNVGVRRTVVESFVDAANRLRARYGIHPLRMAADLEEGSAYQASFCRSRGALIHGRGAAEILAQNSTGFEFALDQWVASPAHRALLLSPSFTYAGAAVVKDSYGRSWCAMRFR